MANTELANFLLSKVDQLPAVASLASLWSPDGQLAPDALARVAAAMEQDPTLARQVAGSAGVDVQNAVMALGLKTVESLMVTRGGSDGPNAANSDTLDLMQANLWRHSKIVGHCCQLLAKEVSYPQQNDAFVAGLFHDIGKAVLNRYAFEEINAVLRVTSAKAKALFTAEDEAFGFNHSYIGAKIVARWGLPVQIREAVEFHHSPEKATADVQLTEIVHLGNVLVNWIQMKLGLKSNFYPLRPYILDKFNIPTDRLRQIAEEANEVVRSTAH
ncbi:MAG: HDOD domain-containing protein [Cyanobacteria bacterium REEB65]|nr:HDOD domain-containing protein [Cyanobacteria bacterium REEB65]